MSRSTRSLSVTVLVVLQTLVGVLALVSGIAAVFVRMRMPEAFPQIRPLRMALFTTGVAFIIFAVLDFAIAYGLWVGRRWAWGLSLLFSVFGVIFAVFSLFLRPRIGQLFALVIDIVILFYLMQPRVQVYFGRRPPSVTAGPSAVASGAQRKDGVKLGAPSDSK